MAGKMSAPLGVLYIFTQILAGIIGSMSFYALYGAGIPFGPGVVRFSWYQVLSVEFLFTFMLVFTVLSTACVKQGNQYFGMAIGFVIIAGGNAAGWISGGAFNPAVGIGLDASDWGSGFGWSMPYNIAQMLGGAAAAAAFRFVRSDEYGDNTEDTSWYKPVYKYTSPSYELLARQLVCEFIGTFFLVLTVGLNVLKGGKLDSEDPLNEAAVFSIAASLMCMIYSVGPVSGAHLNPAVTLAVLLSQRNKISVRDAGCYVGVQVCGGLLAAVFYVFIASGKTFDLGFFLLFLEMCVLHARDMYNTCVCVCVCFMYACIMHIHRNVLLLHIHRNVLLLHALSPYFSNTYTERL